MKVIIKYSDEGLKANGLKNELRKIALYIQEYESISNSGVQELYDVSKATATRYLNELGGPFLKKVGSTGVGTIYHLKGSQWTKNSELKRAHYGLNI